jgi:hypothetical protein
MLGQQLISIAWNTMEQECFSIASTEADSVNGLSTLKLELGPGSNSRSVFFRTRDAVLAPNPEAWFCLALLPSMKLGVDLCLDALPSPKLLGAVDRLSDIYCSWYPDFHRASLPEARLANNPQVHGEGVASFFTGGMDSFYTLLKHRDEITHVIFVHGIDVGLRDMRLRRQVSDMLERVGREFGVGVIEIESNIRGFFEHHQINWEAGHGAAFTCIGHLLASSFRRIYIPSSFTYAELFPWGSHPLTDPLWSSESLEFVHDGSEASRVQKAVLLAQSDVALQSLRVCFHNLDSAYNCGRCEKCVRTMINLHAAGALARCTTFPNKLDLKRVRRLAVMKDCERAFLRENLRALENRPEDRELYEILRKLLQRPIWLSRLHVQFWRRMRVWKRSFRRRLGLEPRWQWPVLGGDDDVR